MVTTMAQIMARDPQTVSATATVAEAARRMRVSGAAEVVLIDQGRVMGILTDRDIALHVVAEERAASTLAGEIRGTEPLVTIRPDAGIEQAAQLMRERATSRLLVAEGDRIIGVVSLTDLTSERDLQGRLRRPPDPSTG